MFTSRAKWRLSHFWPIPFMLVGLLWAILAHQWLVGASWLFMVIMLAVSEKTSMTWYMAGWFKGQVYQAEVMGSDQPDEKKRQLLRCALMPWDHLTTKPGMSRDDL